jgi:hypothetical protein
MPPRLPIRLRCGAASDGSFSNATHRIHCPVISTSRQFSISSRKSTDGVFKELTNERLAVPWIEALRKRDAGQADKVNGRMETGAERKLKPKRIKDSYHSVVCSCLAIYQNVEKHYANLTRSCLWLKIHG